MTTEIEVEISWVALAACHGMDPDLFFPERGASAATAKAVCAGCPVADECARYAIKHCIKFGIWGGLSERQRRAMRAAPPPPAPIRHGTRSGYRAELARGLGTCAACREINARTKVAAEARARDRANGDNPIIQSPLSAHRYTER